MPAAMVAVPRAPPGREEDEGEADDQGQGGGGIGGDVPVVQVGHTAVAVAVDRL